MGGAGAVGVGAMQVASSGTGSLGWILLGLGAVLCAAIVGLRITQ